MQRYVQQMSRSKQWGTFVELGVASKFYRFNARVFCYSEEEIKKSHVDPEATVPAFFALNEETASLPTLHFVLTNRLYNGCAHFWPCVQIKNRTPFDAAALRFAVAEDTALHFERTVYWKTGRMGHSLSAGAPLFVHRAASGRFRLKTKLPLTKRSAITALGGYLSKLINAPLASNVTLRNPRNLIPLMSLIFITLTD